MNTYHVAGRIARRFFPFIFFCLACQTAWAATGRLVLTVVDKDTGRPLACRMHLVGPWQKPFKPDKTPFWYDHFVLPGQIVLKLPLGNYTFEIERGLEYLDRTGHFTINNFADDAKQIELRRFVDMSAQGWWSGELDINRPIRDIELLMQADDLHIAAVVAWHNEKVSWSGKEPPTPILQFDDNHFCRPMAGVWSWSGTELLLSRPPAPIADYPWTIDQLSTARQQGDDLWVDATKPYWWDVPFLVAAGLIDSIRLAHSNLRRESARSDEGDGRPRDRTRWPGPWGNAQWSQHIYFQLLECGLRIPPSAGSGSGESPNPVGYNRLYVHLDGPLSYDKWLEGLRSGKVIVTNGPLLLPSVNGCPPGEVFQVTADQPLELQLGLTLSTRQPISYLEIVRNGKVEHSIPFDVYSKSGRLPELRFERAGWFLIRAVTDLPKTYRFAMTGPYYVELDGQRRISKSAVQFFLDWVEQRASMNEPGDAEHRDALMRWRRQAQDFWRDLLSRANAE